MNLDGEIPCSYRSANGRDARISHIVSITSKNIAGMKNENDNDGIVIELVSSKDPNMSHVEADFSSATAPNAGLVAITGESGSGKSVLVSKAIELVTGGKAAASLFPPSIGLTESSESCSVEIGE